MGLAPLGIDIFASLQWILLGCEIAFVVLLLSLYLYGRQRPIGLACSVLTATITAQLTRSIFPPDAANWRWLAHAIAMAAIYFAMRQYRVSTPQRDCSPNDDPIFASGLTFETIFKSAQDPMLVFEFDQGRCGHVLEANDQVLTLTGARAEQVLGKPVANWLTDHKGEGYGAFERELAEKGTATAKLSFKKTDGATTPVEVVAQAFCHAGFGQGDVALAVARNITDIERERAEHRRLAARMQRAQHLESLAVLAGGIAHDFNNLLAVMLGHAELALDTAGRNSAASHDLQRLKRSAKRAAELTSQLLAYAGKGTTNVTRIQINHAIEEVLLQSRHILPDNVTISTDLSDELPTILVDDRQLRDLLVSLLTNATEAIGEKGGKVSLRTGLRQLDRERLDKTHMGEDLATGKYSFLQISDSGCGMTHEVQKRIFEPFFSTKVAGRGLGLAAVLGIIRGHGGTMDVESQPGCGTVITVLFPYEPIREPTNQLLSGNQKECWVASGRILIIDDDDEVLNVEARLLERAGLDVVTARSGTEGLKAYSEHDSSLSMVLLDWKLPDIDGRLLLERMLGARQDIPIILTTGFEESEARHCVRYFSLAGFLPKPAATSELLETVRAILERDKV